MQFKLRSVNTKFWEDPFIESLKPDEKLLFLYFLTNPLTNMLGIYEVSIKRISYDTGINQERIRKALKAFEKEEKVYYYNSYVILPNFLKNQNLNTNMQKGAINNYSNLPKWLKDSISEKPLEAFETLRNTLLNMNRIGIEYEDELEEEIEKENKEGLIYPFDSEEFKKWWNMWKEYKSKEYGFKYKSDISEQAALKKISELSNGNEELSIKIIEQSIAGGWKGFFDLKKENKVTASTIQSNLEDIRRKKEAGYYE